MNKLALILTIILVGASQIAPAKVKPGMRIDPILSSDPQLDDPGYMCSFIRTKKSYLDVGGGTTSQLIFKIDGKPVVRTLSETKIKWFQEFGFSVDGVKSSSGSISVPSYTISLTRIGKVTEGEDGQSIPAILKITKVGVSASLSGAWVCGG